MSVETTDTVTPTATICQNDDVRRKDGAGAAGGASAKRTR